MEKLLKVKKTDNKSVTDQVFESLKNKIVNYEWVPGDRLPSENDLAESFGVSRMSIRMAIQKLIALGMVESKSGGGTYVIKFNFSSVVGNISGMMAHHIDYEDVNSFRNLIETKAVMLLKDKPINAKDIKYLEACCERMDKYSRNFDRAGFASADYDFHRHICKMSGNTMFVYSYELVGPIFLEYLDQHYRKFRLEKLFGLRYDDVIDYYLKAVAEHINIIEALKVNDIDRCVKIIDQLTASSPIARETETKSETE